MSYLSSNYRRRALGRPAQLRRINAHMGKSDVTFDIFSTGRALTRMQLAVILFLIWTAIGAARSVPYILQGSAGPWVDLVEKLIDAWVWALLTPALIFVDRQLTRLDVKVYRQVIVLAVLSIPFTVAHVYLTAMAEYPFPGIWWSPFRSPDYTVHFFAGGWITYCGMVGVWMALKYYRRFMTSRLELERMEKRLLESHLNALRLQLEPHFLFNALNTISSEVGANQQVARNMIGNLAELLRHSLTFADTAEITLSQELELLEHYLAIQRVRFGDRIRIELDVEPEVLQAAVPCMLLQPLVENAIRHGIEGRLSGGAVIVSARRAGDRVEIHVQDNGVGLRPHWRMESSAGLGIKVTRERLSALYGGQSDQLFDVRRRKEGGTEVIISIPLRAIEENTDALVSV